MTILEIMVVLVIVLILASMLLPLYSTFTSRVEQTRCLANLRSLHVAASGYLLANESWPQIPTQWISSDPKNYARSWVTTLAPFGAPHSSWICPTIQRSLGVSMDALEKDEHYRIDFIATPFDDNPASPRRALTHPWFMEKGGVHPRGNLLILGNGATESLQDFVDRGSGS